MDQAIFKLVENLPILDNEASYQHLKDSHKITEWEYTFLTDNIGEKNLTHKQLEYKKNILKNIDDRKAYKNEINQLNEYMKGGLLTEWEFDFMLSIVSKKIDTLSSKQLDLQQSISSRLENRLESKQYYEPYYTKNIITKWEFEFAIDVSGKLKNDISIKQARTLAKINKKIASRS